MVDPRIYRASWVIVFIAVVLFGFSLENRPGGASSQLQPNITFSGTYQAAEQLAVQYGAVSPGSAADTQMAGTLAGELGSAGGFGVSTRTTPVRTAQGLRSIETVVATRAGLGHGTLVVIANRDAARPQSGSGSGGGGASGADATADITATASSAVLVDLAKALSGATLDRSLMLISTSGSVGAAGVSQLIGRLSGQDIDGVIVLGDLAGASASQPVVQPWSGTGELAPPVLTATLNSYLHATAGLSTGYPSFGSELAQLAFPFATGSQAPFAVAGIPAVGLSLAGDRTPQVGGAVSQTRVRQIGVALAESVNALDVGATIPAPAAYLTISSQYIPLWAFQLLVLALICPVAFSLVDAVARSRRRGHSTLSWIVWVLSSIAPFIVGLIIVKAAGLAHVVPKLSAAVDTGVSFSAAGGALIAVTLLAIAVSFRLLRPVGVQMASGIGWRRTPTSPVIEGAVVALSVVMCALTVVVWWFNAFAAALLIPALHVWLWLGSPGIVASRLRAAVMLLAGLILPLLVAVYYMLALGLTPWDFAWSLTLALAGSAISAGTGLTWCVALGVLAGSLVLLARASGAERAEVSAPVTVRGPVGYAGPGSLGGTDSALRR